MGMDPSEGVRPVMERRAISEVIGTVILIGVIVTGMIIVNVVILSAPTQTRIPSLEASMDNQSTIITISHQGGDSIPQGQFRILVDGQDQTHNFTNSGPFPWAIGETLSWNDTVSMPRSAILIYNGTGAGGGVVLLETKFPWGVYVSGPMGSGTQGGGTTPTAPSWWNCAWGYREKLTIVTGASSVPSDSSVSLTFNHAALASAGKSISGGNDLRVVHWDGAGWTELDRALDHLSSWNNVSTTIWFPVVDSIEAYSLDDNYYIYYGNPAANAPPSDWPDSGSPGPVVAVNPEEVSTCTPPVPQPLPGPAWKDCDWAYRRNITIDHTRVSWPGSLPNFPVLVKLNSDHDLWGHAQPDGDDIFFTDSTGMTIPHEIESYSEGTLVAWVKIPSLSSTEDTTIYMYYGNANVSSQQNPTAVWDSNYKGVWHLEEGTGSNSRDSTVNGLNGTPTGSPTQTPGQIDGSLGFSGSNNLSLGTNSPFRQSSVITYEFWAKIPNGGGGWAMGVGGSGGHGYGGVSLALSTLSFTWTPTTPNSDTWIQNASLSLTPNQWVHVAVVVDFANKARAMYINGQAVPTTLSQSVTTWTPTTTYNSGYTDLIGGRYVNGWNYFTGTIDEVRVSNAVRSAEWIATEYANQAGSSPFYTIGSEEGSTCSAPPITFNPCSWNYRKKITIDKTKVSGTTPLSDFPVLVSLTLENPAHVQPNGNDFVFTSSDGTTKLSHEIESYNSGTGALVAWVKVPWLTSASNTDLYLYYGNASTSSQQDPHATWSNGYQEVWHLNESSGNVQDSTMAGYTGTVSGSVNRIAPGKISSAVEFLGPSTVTYLTLNDGDLGNNAPFTVSAWFYLDNPTASSGIVTKGRETGHDWIGLWANESKGFTFGWDSGPGKGGNVSGSVLANHIWYYGVGTFDGLDRRLYLNGSLNGGPKNGNYAGITGSPTSVANDRKDASANTFDGTIDEIRISNVARSADWIKTEYNNQNNTASFFSAIGSEVASPCGPQPPSEEESCAWGYGRNITIYHTQVQGPGSLANFPVLVNLTLNPAHVFQSNGNDIYFTDSNGAQIPHEIESYSSSTGNLVAWVQVPSVSSTVDTTFSIFYGNSTVPSQQNPTGVWDSYFKGVWHLNNSFADSTSNHNDGVNTGTTDAAGRAARGRNFDGSSNDITVADSTSLHIARNVTAEAWINPTSWSSAWRAPVAKDQWDLWMGSDGTGSYLIWELEPQTGGSLEQSTFTISNGAWQHIALTYNGSYVRIYKNGDTCPDLTCYKAGSGDINLKTDTHPFMMGNSPPTIARYKGIIDEVRISNTSRSQQWLKTEYNNQNNPSNFYYIDPEVESPCGQQTQPGPQQQTPNPPWFNCLWTYRRNVTIDASQVVSTQTNFPVLVYNSSNDLKYHARNDGYDFVFTDASTQQNQLSYEREKYDATTGTLTAWVKVPQVNSSAPNTKMYLYYGYPQAFDMSHPTAVWDSNYTGVWHLDETGTGAPGEYRDSTGNANHGTLTGRTVLKASFDMTASSNSSIYENLTSLSSYTIANRDNLSYDVYWTSSKDLVAFDFNTTDQTTLRGSTAKDQNNIAASPAADLSAYALNKWYHRVIPIPAALNGKVIQFYDVACENDSTGTITSYIDNIMIMNGQSIVKKIYLSGDSFTHATHHASNGAIHSFANDADPASTSVAGKVGKALNADGVTYASMVGKATDARNNWTIEAWVYPSLLNQHGYWVYNGNDSGGYGLGMGTSTGIGLGSKLIGLFGSVPPYIDSGYTFPSAGTWYHVVMKRGSGTTYFYVNRAQTGTTSTSTPNAPYNYLTMGNELDVKNTPNRFFNGLIDEVRISNSARSTQWVSTGYNNTNSPSTFATLGSEESYFCGGTSGPYYVQSRSQSYSSVSQAQITLPYSTTGGDLLVLSLVVNKSLPVPSVSDSINGYAYNFVSYTDAGTSWNRTYTYNVPNSLGGGPITATVTLNGVASTLDVFFLEYGGVAATAPVDKYSSNSGSTGTAMDSGSPMTITQAPELIYGFGAGDSACHGTPPYTDRETAGGRCAVDQIVYTAGTFNVIATQGSSGNWALQMVTFKGA
jgi:flagellin-like protein